MGTYGGRPRIGLPPREHRDALICGYACGLGVSWVKMAPMTRSRACVVLSFAGVVALSACGGSSNKAAAPTTTTESAATTATTAPGTLPPPPKKLDSCVLMPKTQAEALIETKLEDPIHESTTDVDSCTYPGDPNGPTAQVEVFIGAGAKEIYLDDLNVLHHTFTDVPGIGDEAHEEDYILVFRKGPTWVTLRLTSLDDFSMFTARMETAAKQLAAQI
jgi:hypothetical protein